MQRLLATIMLATLLGSAAYGNPVCGPNANADGSRAALILAAGKRAFSLPEGCKRLCRGHKDLRTCVKQCVCERLEGGMWIDPPGECWKL